MLWPGRQAGSLVQRDRWWLVAPRCSCLLINWVRWVDQWELTTHDPVPACLQCHYMAAVPYYIGRPRNWPKSLSCSSRAHGTCSKSPPCFGTIENPRFYPTQANWIVLTFSKLKTLNDARRVYHQTFFPNHLRFVPGFILFQSLNEGSKTTGAVWHLPCPRPLPQCSKPTSV